MRSQIFDSEGECGGEEEEFEENLGVGRHGRRF
jgi:hypothetical protein